MKFSSIIAAAVVVSGLSVSASASAQENTIENVLSNFISSAVSVTATEMQYEVEQAVANTTHFFTVEANEKVEGKVTIKELAVNEQEEKDSATEVE